MSYYQLVYRKQNEPNFWMFIQAEPRALTAVPPSSTGTIILHSLYRVFKILSFLLTFYQLNPKNVDMKVSYLLRFKDTTITAVCPRPLYSNVLIIGDVSFLGTYTTYHIDQTAARSVSHTD